MHYLGKHLTAGKCSCRISPDAHCPLTGDGIHFGTNVLRLVNCCGSWARCCREACLLLPDWVCAGLDGDQAPHADEAKSCMLREQAALGSRVVSAGLRLLRAAA